MTRRPSRRRCSARRRGEDCIVTPEAADVAMPADAARAFWIAAPGRGEIRRESLPPPVGRRRRRPDAVQRRQPRHRIAGVPGTRAGRTNISGCGRRFRPATFPAPIKYGYASVGRIEQRPARAAGPHGLRAPSAPDALRRPGRRRCTSCPTMCRPARAVLTAYLETAINGLWDARPHIGDRIVGRRRRHRRLSGRLAGWTHSGLRRRAGRHQPAARGDRPRLGVRFAAPDSASGMAPTSSFTPAARPRAWSWRCGSPGSKRRSSR